MGVEWQMEQGDWCTLWWVHSECILAVPGLLCFHSAAPGHGERPAGAERDKGAWQPRKCLAIAVWKYTGLFVCDAVIWITCLSWIIFTLVCVSTAGVPVTLMTVMQTDCSLKLILYTYACLSDTVHHNKCIRAAADDFFLSLIHLRILFLIIQSLGTWLRWLMSTSNPTSLVADFYQLSPFQPTSDFSCWIWIILNGRRKKEEGLGESVSKK